MLWPVWNVLLFGETGFVLLHCDTVELPHFLVWQVLEGGWCLLPPRELFVLQVLGPVVVPPPEEHDVGTLLLAVGRGIMAIDEA